MYYAALFYTPKFSSNGKRLCNGIGSTIYRILWSTPTVIIIVRNFPFIFHFDFDSINLYSRNFHCFASDVGQHLFWMSYFYMHNELPSWSHFFLFGCCCYEQILFSCANNGRCHRLLSSFLIRYVITSRGLERFKNFCICTMNSSDEKWDAVCWPVTFDFRSMGLLAIFFF